MTDRERCELLRGCIEFHLNDEKGCNRDTFNEVMEMTKPDAVTKQCDSPQG